ncbi:metal-dependent hydrolase [Halobacterium salinarum]|uniref:metal-dependent hydrolase n=1 Tax=Halobacterium salinarum TaxID=2242 RepID=UPI003D78894A
MPDLLTHVLIGYTIGSLVATQLTHDRSTVVTLVMLGTILPDLTKIKLIVPDIYVETLLNIPFSWLALHTLGGVLVTATIGASLVDATRRKHAFVLLVLGAVSHLSLDALLIKPSGYSGPLWWPFLKFGLPTPGLFLSSNRWPAVVAGLLAFLAYWRN